VEADVDEVLVADVGKRPDHAVQEGLGANEAVIGQQIGPIG
jgi:hypothetical protein